VPKTFCHGDLTFANIIFHKNRLFFIDFLDSYIDSFYCDLVKLKQELYYFWNLRVQNKMNLRMVQIYKKIWDTLSCKYEKSIQTDEFEILDVMNTLRLEPYLTNDNQRFTLNKMVTSTKLYEKFNSSNGREI
jgi:tRNA A-37 threonylcarbamoyl transferase component Bud32